MKKKYGIWGLGVVGTSVLRFLHAHAQQYAVNKLSVMDKRSPSPEEAQFLKEHSITYINQSDQNQFFVSNDILIPSPGIDIQEASAFASKMVEEIDLFADSWKKPIIAVTGTLGKTSVVHLLSLILEHNKVKLATGGNIGTGMLDLIGQEADYSLLELSSFQLERAQRFAPDIVIITNLYPNHLDRHKDMAEYLQAKYRIMLHQQPHQKALVPWALAKALRPLSKQPTHYFTAHPQGNEQELLTPQETLYVLKNNELRKITHSTDTFLYSLQDLPALSYHENWLILLAACDMLGILAQKTFSIPPLDLPQHRLEKVGTAQGITFYNDSKSTITEATMAAVQHLLPARIHLFLGGLSKGVDRTALIAEFQNKVASITCFGVEADALFQACAKAAIPAQKYTHLEEAFKACIEKAHPNDVVLFSPGGASLDQFKNYKERGDLFVKLVKALEI